MINSLCFDIKQNKTAVNLAPSEWKDIIADQDQMLWVDLTGPASDEFKEILEEIFHFHTLAVEDALIETHVPRVDDWKNFIYIVLRCVDSKSDKVLEIETPELDVFIGRNYLVTYHEMPSQEIETLLQRSARDQRYLEKGPANLFYHLADEMVNQYLPVIELISESIDRIEDEIFNDPRTETLNQIFTLKRTMLRLRRTFLPQQEVFSKLARGDFEIIHDQFRVYFRDIYDHMIRLEEINESLRDLVSGALDTYLSVVNNRMNDIMKTLTIITTLFMPLAFITGFFGMNFFQPAINLGGWTGDIVFYAVLAGTIAIPLIMFLWMRKRAWM